MHYMFASISLISSSLFISLFSYSQKRCGLYFLHLNWRKFAAARKSGCYVPVFLRLTICSTINNFLPFILNKKFVQLVFILEFVKQWQWNIQILLATAHELIKKISNWGRGVGGGSEEYFCLPGKLKSYVNVSGLKFSEGWDIQTLWHPSLDQRP